MRRIYLDYNASTPIDPAVAAAMRPFLEDHFGNPSSGHWASAGAKAALETARAQVAAMLGAKQDEIVFTSGGSEANNLALKGVAGAVKAKGGHIVINAVEHPAIVAPCHFLRGHGLDVSVVPVDRFGRVDPDDIRRAITSRTVLVSIMHANNEVGTIQPIAAVSRIARAHGILLHTDAAQSVGKMTTDVDILGVDLLTVAGHKVHAPKGVGALYVRLGTRLEPLIHGAGHEDGRRAGTESALLAVGLGTACALARDLAPMERVRSLRDRFWQRLRETFGDLVVLNGHPVDRLPTRSMSPLSAGSAPRCWPSSTGLPRPQGPPAITHRAVAGAAGDTRGAGGRDGRDPLQPRARHHVGGDRHRRRPACNPACPTGLAS
jgi:cysteine desulfurase